MSVKKVTKELKENFKKEHGEKLKSLLLPLDDYGNEELEVLAVVPSRSIVGQSMRFMQADPKKAQEILVKNCLLTSKEEVLTDDGLFYAAANLIYELVPIRQGKFGKV
jgi:hypothetical protein